MFVENRLTGRIHTLRLAVLISGQGRSLKNLLDRINDGLLDARIEIVVSSDPAAGGMMHAHDAEIPVVVAETKRTRSENDFSRQVFAPCRTAQVDLVLMAGFIKHVMVPPDFRGRVLNIHPALLPKFGGKGFYGMKVHEAVLAAGEAESGCTVHVVNEEYDQGPVLLQRRVPVLANDTPQTLADRVFEQECELYPEVIQKIARGELRLP